MKPKTRLLLVLMDKLVKELDVWLDYKEKREEADQKIKFICQEIVENFGVKNLNKVENLSFQEIQTLFVDELSGN